MRVVIIEDERSAAELLTLLLTRYEGAEIEVVKRIGSVAKSIEFFSSEECRDVDLVFMDIHLSDGYAFSIFKSVEVYIPIIFTTAYDEYALKAFKVNCLDYLLKPLSERDIVRLFDKVATIAEYSDSLRRETRRVKSILVNESWYTLPLNIEDIAYLYTYDFKVTAYTFIGKKYHVNLTLEKLSDILDNELFMRVNRQFIIAHSSVKSIESWEGARAHVELHIATPEPIVISRKKVTVFKNWLSKQSLIP